MTLTPETTSAVNLHGVPVVTVPVISNQPYGIESSVSVFAACLL